MESTNTGMEHELRQWTRRLIANVHTVFLRIAKPTPASALLFGVCSALVAISVSFVATYAFDQSALGSSAGRNVVQSGWALAILFALFLIPLIETAISPASITELVRKFGGSIWVAVGLNAMFFAGGHYLNGGLGHSIAAASSSIFFTTYYFQIRTTTPLFAAIGFTWIVHATQNLLVILLSVSTAA